MSCGGWPEESAMADRGFNSLPRHLMTLFTGKGDGGTSKFFGEKERITKSSTRFWTLGNIDELNSLLGYARGTANHYRLREVAEMILDAQQKLFIVQAEIAAGDHLTIQPLSETATAALEEKINLLEKKIGPITKFSVPGGHPLSGLLDFARAVCRRTERSVVEFSEEKFKQEKKLIDDETLAQGINPAVLSYVNRLSSLLFALARYANKYFKVIEKNPTYEQ